MKKRAKNIQDSSGESVSHSDGFGLLAKSFSFLSARGRTRGSVHGRQEPCHQATCSAS